MKENKFSWKTAVNLGCILLVSGSFIACNQNTSIQPQKSTVAVNQTSGFDRPFPNIPVEYERFEIDPNEDQILVSQEGSAIRIPAGSLVDANGQPCTEKVEIQYREFRDMVDVFLSGIPMKYDSAGSEFHFESAGMFELLGTQGGEAIAIEEGTAITVDFASAEKGNQFNLYSFNQENGQWIMLGKDNTKDQSREAKKVKKADNKLRQEEKKFSEVEAKAPVKPQKASPDELNMNVVFDKKEYPELAVYGKLSFQVINREQFKPEYAQMEWNDVKIEKNEQGEYLLKFIRYDLEKSFKCKPVFEGENYDNALATFEAKRKESEAIIEVQEEALKQAQIEYAKRLKALREAALQDSIRWAGMRALASNKERVMREFRVESFGVYNSDCPRLLPKGRLLAAHLKNKDVVKSDSTLNFNRAYLVEHDKNALYTYYNLDRFSFNPESKNLLWTITDENQLAVLSPEDFKSLKGTKDYDSVMVNMTVVDVNFKNEMEIRKYLKL